MSDCNTLQVYGACSSSMSAIINPLIYLNTNQTFKKFVINALKCQNEESMKNQSQATFSQVL